MPLQAEAKKQKVQSDKEAVILLPLVISVEAQSMSSEMQAAVVQGLQHKYLVYSGDRVLQELKKAADKENHRAKHDCDETRCLQDVATAFQTENVAIAHINKIDGGYLLSLSIKAVISNEAVFDNSIPCKGCDPFAVVEKLKELSGTVAPVTFSAPVTDEPKPKIEFNDPETALWEEVKKGNAEDDYQAYLSQFPNGKYVALANSKLKRLKEEAQGASAKQDQQAWSTAQQTNSQDSYASYINQYPQGQFTALARGRIEKIKRELATADAKRQQEHAAEAERQKKEAVAMPKGFVSQGGLTWMPVSFYNNWSDANSYCINTAINGKSGWRLPTKDELKALYDSRAMNDQGWTLGNTWSSTPDSAGGHYYVLLGHGGSIPYYDLRYGYVACVR
jgi:hypothetical protein